MTTLPDAVWHVLDVSSVPVEEFASALYTLVPTLAWQRRMSSFATLHSSVKIETRSNPPLDVARFTLQRGFSNPLLSWKIRFAEKMAATLQARTRHPHSSPLICTSPFYAPVAELWPGPVIYYSTDLTVAYDRLNAGQVLALDRRLCAVAKLVCPNSNRIGHYLTERAACRPNKILCLPNATRSVNVLDDVPKQPSNLPPDIADLSRPIAGVIGNLSGNLDWILLEQVIERAHWLSWVFVGPSSMHISERSQRQARQRVMHAGSRVCFVGSKPYGELKDYARSFDVAILPYLRREPTFSGSPTRFYEHLAACRPMIATRGVEQLLEKEPLVRLVSGSEEMLTELEQLRAAGFQDRFEQIRWVASRTETWLHRAEAMIRALVAIGGLNASPLSQATQTTTWRPDAIPVPSDADRATARATDPI